MVNAGELVRVADNLMTTLKSHFISFSGRDIMIGDILAIWYIALDVEERLEELSDQQRRWLEEARDAIFEADDFIDEILTRNQNQPLEGIRCFPALPHLFPSTMRQSLEQVMNNLHRVVHDHSKTDFNVIRGFTRTRPETNSYISVGDVIGRENDVNSVVNMLLRPSCHSLSIVGMGGIGKTTLAQLVFNDVRVQTQFPMRLWVSVSDLRGSFDKKSILAKILELATHEPLIEAPGMDQIWSKLPEVLDGKRFLIVLDDVWCEERKKWLQLIRFLAGEENRVVVTTRSRVTTQIVAKGVGGATYELKGLSKEDSWSLFRRTAFRETHQPPELLEIGVEIVERCYNVPLAIKCLATALFNKPKNEWRRFQRERSAITTQLPEFMSDLKLSYDNLENWLKRRFSYCALFPEDCVIEKETLNSLWSAQGCIFPFTEVSFKILLKRYFLEAVEIDEWGEVTSYRIHPLMHALAEHVAGREIWHLHQTADQYLQNITRKNLIRSYLANGFNLPSVDILVRQCTSLRVLDLHGLDMRTLPDSIGDLLHLRYLNLSHNVQLKALPNTIVRLCNLQTLDLRFCILLKEWPQGFSKLSKLRCLNISGCDGLMYMPSGMDELTFLAALPKFVVADQIASQNQVPAQLTDLRRLVELRGHLCISIPKSSSRVNRIDWRGGCLNALACLRKLSVLFLDSHSEDDSDERVVSYHQALTGKLQPHENLQALTFRGYQGRIFPRWGQAQNSLAKFLPNLVKIELRSCEKLQQLPLMCHLYKLKSLKLYGLKNLEYLGKTRSSLTSATAPVSRITTGETAYFPSLEELEIADAPKLRRFWGTVLENHDRNDGLNNRSGRRAEDDCSVFAPNLVRLELRSCQRLQELPSLKNLRHLKSLKLYGLSNLECLEETSSCNPSAVVSGPDLVAGEAALFPSLEALEIVDAAMLTGCWTLSRVVNDNDIAPPTTLDFPCLKYLMLANLPEVKGWFHAVDSDAHEEVRHGIHPHIPRLGCLSELRISDCQKLMSMPIAPNLEFLEVNNVHWGLLKHFLQSQRSVESSSRSSRLQNVDISCIVESLTIIRCQDLNKLL